MIRRRQQRGSVAPFMALAIGGALLATAYTLDTSRMTNSAGQVKRATDAAAMAVGNERLINGDQPLETLQVLAEGYVLNNLGMDSTLGEQIGRENIVLSQTSDDQQRLRYTVEVTFEANPELLGGEVKQISVHSTVEVVARATEIALMLPNTLSENSTELAALRRLAKDFAVRMLGTDGDSDQRIWISLVPYGQAVNVFDIEGGRQASIARLRRWATGLAISPVELTSLFRTGTASSLADARMPDLASNLMCMNRGLNPGQNYFWDQSPSGQFTRVYYRADLPENTPGAKWLSWVGPNPTFGQASGTNDTRFIVADKGCPTAAVLPLTNDVDALEERLALMDTGFNVNYAIGMGWAAHTLSPEMRGSNGWGDEELPLDFAEGEQQNAKIIVMLANTTGDWFDTDSYNSAVVGEAIDGTSDSISIAARRFESLCNSFRQRNLKFHFIGVRPGDPMDFGRTLFDRVAGPGLQLCTQGTGSMTFANAPTFNEGEAQIENLLAAIAEQIKHEYYARLVE